jgi:hypothetical protein
MAALITLGDFGRFGRVKIQSFFDTDRWGQRTSGLCLCPSYFRPQPCKMALCMPRRKKLLECLGAGPKSRGWPRLARYRANYAEFWRPISSSAYWGEAVQHLSWCWVANDPKPTSVVQMFCVARFLIILRDVRCQQTGLLAVLRCGSPLRSSAVIGNDCGRRGDMKLRNPD